MSRLVVCNDTKTSNNMTYTKEQFEKLPKWAQSEIKSLERYKMSLEQRLSEYKGEAKTNTYIIEGLEKIPIQNNAQIEFQTGEGNNNKVNVYTRKDGSIDVNTDSRIGHTMVVIPRAANSFYITFVEL